MKQTIILASSSPRRKKLLQQAGLKFKVMPSKAREAAAPGLPPRKLVEKLAEKKAADVAKRAGRGIVIGADTLLVCGRTRLGKPSGKKQAFSMLKRMSGRKLKAYSGVAIIDAKTGRKAIDSEETTITMRKLTDAEIRAYVRTGEPLGKAGAIAVQGRGAAFISRIEGCSSNVMGLPMHALCKNLRKFGVSVPGKRACIKAHHAPRRVIA